jgi:hypothetical protein
MTVANENAYWAEITDYSSLQSRLDNISFQSWNILLKIGKQAHEFTKMLPSTIDMAAMDENGNCPLGKAFRNCPLELLYVS